MCEHRPENDHELSSFSTSNDGWKDIAFASVSDSPSLCDHAVPKQLQSGSTTNDRTFDKNGENSAAGPSHEGNQFRSGFRMTIAQSRFWAGLGHLSMAVVASSFTVFALLCASVHNTFPSSTKRHVRSRLPFKKWEAYNNHTNQSLLGNYTLNEMLREAGRLGPTIFPLVFSAVASSSSRLLARFLADRGSQLMALEIMIGSGTLFSSIASLISLRLCNSRWIVIVALWILSPIAGQASSRILARIDIHDETLRVFWRLLDTSVLGPWTDFNQTAALTGKLGFTYFVSLTWGPNLILQESPGTDARGSALIPWLDVGSTFLYPKDEARTGASSQHYNLNYSSYISVPMLSCNSDQYADRVAPLVDEGYVSFDIQMLRFDCPSSGLNLTAESEVSDKLTDTKDNRSWDWGFNLTKVPPDLYDPKWSIHSPMRVRFQSTALGEHTTRDCNMYPIFHTCNASCSPAGQSRDLNSITSLPCQLISVKPNPNLEHTTKWLNSTIDAIFQVWSAIDPGCLGIPSVTEMYIATGNPTTGLPFTSIAALGDAAFAMRLTQAFNTYWLLSLMGMDENFEGNVSLTNSTSASPVLLAPFPVVRCIWGYFLIVLFTSLLLVVFALFSIWLRYQIKSPDLLGYISSMNIDGLEERATARSLSPSLDGIERTRRLSDAIVKMTPVGHENRGEYEKLVHISGEDESRTT